MCSIEDMDSWSVLSPNPICGSQTFTLIFAEAIMTILPVCLTLIAAAVRLVYLSKDTYKARRERLWRSKMTFWILLAMIQLAQLCITALHSTPKTRVSVATAALSLFSSAFLICLSDMEHRLSSRPSDILSIFLFVTITLDVIRIYSLWIIGGTLSVAILLIVTEVVKFAILMLESWNKQGALKQPYVSYPPEALSGIISRSTFWWLNHLMWLGYKESLSLDMLYDLDPKISARNTSDRFVAGWKLENQEKPHSLLYYFFWSNKWVLFAGVIPRLCLVAFTFSQPFLLSRIIDHEDNPETSDSARTWDVIAYVVVYTGIAVSTGGYEYYTTKFVTLVRGGLVSLLFDKALSRHPKATEESVSSAITLLNSDTERITLGLQQIHNSWASLIEVGISTWLLARQLGLAAIASVLFCFLCLIIGNIIAAMANQWLKLWLEAIQKRVNFTTRIVSQYRSVKMAGLSKLLSVKLGLFRENEIKVSKIYRGYVVSIFSLTYVSNTIAPVLGFTIFVLSKTVHGSRSFDSTRAFAALTVFSLLTQAVSMFIQSMLEVMNAFGCFERYRKFLLEDESPEGVKSETAQPRHRSTSDFELTGLNKTLHSNTSPSQDSLPDLLIAREIIKAKSANIGWDNDRAIIKDATFTIRQGSLTVIKGDTASGKSTLVKAFLGLAVVQKGKLDYRFPNAGYSSQEPWLMKGTLRQNVIGPSKYDAPWYETVLENCALNMDISRMGQGDNTLIGGEGIRLSGGQQSRLALARAVYSRHGVMLFDDIFSALDPATMNIIMTNLFSTNGLLRKLKTTIIIVSNSDSLAELANSVLEIQADGSIREDVISRPKTSLPAEQDIGFEYNAFVPISGAEPEKKQDGYPASASTKLEITALETANQNREQNTNDRVYRYYFKTAGRRNIIAFVVLVTGLVFGLYFPQVWVSWWTAPNHSAHNWGNGVYIGVYFALGVFSLFCIASGGLILMLLIVPNSASKLHANMLRTLFRAPVLWILQRDDGEVINRFSQDLGLVDAVIPLSSFVTVFSGLTCIIQAIYICVSSKYLVIIVVGCIAVLFLVQIFYLRTSRQLRILDLEATAPLVSQVLEAIQGNTTIKALGWEAAFRERQLELLDQSQKPYFLLPMIQRWLGFVLDLIVAGIAVVLVALTVLVRGSATQTFLGAGLTGVVNFALNMNVLIQNWVILETAIQAIWRIKVFCEETPSEETSSTVEPPADWPPSGRISFQNVYASYVTGAIDVLEDITFEVEPGQKVGICGRTGSGKSSMLSALSKILEVSRGSITIDGLDLKCISPDSLRERILTLPQSAVLVPGTIRENVDPSGTLSDFECISFLETVGLWDSLESKDGLDATANEQSLSAGQSQLLVLARALAHPRSVMMMDEITSNVDAKTDQLIRDIVRENFNKNTIISVSHKLEHLLECDKVVVVSNGRLQEYDDPRVLLDRADSHFRALFF